MSNNNDEMNGPIDTNNSEETEKVTPEIALREALDNVDKISHLVIVGIGIDGRSVYTNSFMPIPDFVYIARFLNSRADKMAFGE